MSSEFHLFAKAVEARFRAIEADELYVVDVPDLFDRYLAFYPEGTNPIFRERTEHDCSCCKNFVRHLGNVVAINAAGEILTVWDVEVPGPFATVAREMAALVRKAPIKSIFRTKEGKYGAEKSHELIDGADTRTWNHFWGMVPRKSQSDSPEADRGTINTNIGVFRRGLEELTAEAIGQVIDMIDANALYRGAEFKETTAEFYRLHRDYPRERDEPAKAIFLWSNIRNRSALFRNTVIGTLVVDLSAGVELDHAVGSFEQKVAPLNYKRPTALITPKMIEDGVAKLRELGLEGAIDRRFARIDDVTVTNVLWVDNAVKPQMKGGLEGLLLESVRPAQVDIKGAVDISMDEFLTSVLPTAGSVDVLVENGHLPNFVSITAPADPAAGRLFKWNNGFAWSYDGDAADSIKQRVKRAGGNVEAQFRVSLAWSNTDDLDLHVLEPRKRVYFGDKHGIAGDLDVDMNAPYATKVRDPVENYAVPFGRDMRDGTYVVEINCYELRETIEVGFTLEVEYQGVTQHFSYPRGLRARETLQDALTFVVNGGEVVSIAHHVSLVPKAQSQNKWGVPTETLVPLDTLMASPNHWDGQGIGNKHWFFILKGCRNPDQARGIYNEFLKAELDPHRKVFEVVGAKTKCPPADQQLSGVGFSSTSGDTVRVVAKTGAGSRAFNICF